MPDAGSGRANPRVVLVVDDDPAMRGLVAVWLSDAGIQTLEASSGEEALAAIAAAPGAIDAILLDVMMPDADGFEVLRRIKDLPKSARIPVVFLSAATSETDIVRGVKAGAVDYLEKPFSGPVLVTKVQAVIERARAERVLEDRLHSAEANATHDALTGLANRGEFDTRLAEMMANSIRHREPLALLMIDIDDFKSVNDAFGHLAGDEALQYLAAKLRAVTRAGDGAFRYGGEEFVLLLRKCDRVGAVAIYDRLRESLRAAPFALGRGQKAPFSVSGGVSSIEADNGFRAVNLFGRADAALYVAKRAGRDRVALEEAESLRA